MACLQKTFEGTNLPALVNKIMKVRYLKYKSRSKCSMCISDYIQTTFFYLGKFLKKLADDQCSSTTNASLVVDVSMRAF